MALTPSTIRNVKNTSLHPFHIVDPSP